MKVITVNRRRAADEWVEKKGYKRILLSYLPLVLTMISAVIFVSFIIVTDQITKEAEKANAVSTGYIADTLESTVEEIEVSVLRELAINRSLNRFMNDVTGENIRVTQYELSRDLDKLAGAYPELRSIYVYRSADAVVLTQREITPLPAFPDKEFVAAHFPSNRARKWLPVRSFTDSVLTPPRQVISLIQRFPLPLGSQGMVVINVDTDKLIRRIDHMTSPDVALLDIRDANGQSLQTAGGNEDQNDQNSVSATEEYTFERYSSYLGWTLHSGLKKGPLSRWVSVISYLWIAIGIAVAVLCLFACVYIFKRSYRPVELLLERIRQVPLQHLPKQKAADEFAYIEKALENLVETTRHYEQRHQEDWMLGKRQFIRDWLEGEQPVTDEEWQEKARLFGLPELRDTCAVAVVELNDYRDFTQRNGERDQRFLKFSLVHVIRERWQIEGSIETEWIAPDRLAVLWMSGVTDDLLVRMGKLIRWVAHHLNLTVRIGVGLPAHSLADAADSFRQANAALRYKLIHDQHSAIPYAVTAQAAPYSAYSYYRMMAACMKELRAMNESWKQQSDAIFSRMQEERLADEELLAIVQYGLMLLLEEAESVADPVVRSQLEEVVTELRTQMEHTGQLSELHTLFHAQLERYFAQYALYKTSNKYLETINRVKQYIEKHFADPDLSLTHISDKFALKPKYASQLFKEEFGMKFVDFLVQLRMEDAKRRLVETTAPVQDIAQQVGYTTSIAFGRMFKKLEGITPGDYRKMKVRPQQGIDCGRAAE
ncbi:helix-turn-helix domain-containing protein [Paenibacillus peoriae]|uniref:helix-turn-helix domain-containing protein n=1 Tax=Paenibacillus peoriae TaxID=59893 RepID=UPI00026C5A48|nr:helix-turn-helix domain-containing protein [Paenibacillus peoriae]MEC0181223.1 helix-turn-helix domain-containing protein [Paenibacillus peoriae]